MKIRMGVCVGAVVIALIPVQGVVANATEPAAQPAGKCSKLIDVDDDLGSDLFFLGFSSGKDAKFWRKSVARSAREAARLAKDPETKRLYSSIASSAATASKDDLWDLSLSAARRLDKGQC